MVFKGDQLRAILTAQTEPVQVLNAFGRLETTYQNPHAATKMLCRGNYYGIGQKKRIRFIRPEGVEEGVTAWGAELDFNTPKGARAETIHKNRTSKDAKRWKSRPDKSRTGAMGSIVRLRVG
jgi:hypothetical protein